MTTRFRPVSRWGAVLVIAMLSFGFVGGTAVAQEIEPKFKAPVVLVDRGEVRAGESIVVTIAGFRSPAVTVALCGNAARRGSVDCDMPGAKAVELQRDGSSTVSDFVVSDVSTPCPCLVRVSSPENAEVAVADITLIGHPVAPVVGRENPADPLAISISAQRRSGGILATLRSSLGGSTEYDVLVTIRNRTTEPIAGVSIDARAERGDRVLRGFDVDPPSVLEPGATWEETVRAELPAPVYGSVRWSADVASANASTVVAGFGTSHFPGLLLILAAVLLVDLVVLMVRFVRRRRSRVDAEETEAMPAPYIDLTGREPVVTPWQ